ncbi:hypothetical protein GOODEAATRI_006461 [Goodea atripinnis]|uniref:Uncharacterized protein n=1 Tax=Goodea atripinnis TaxID=208336 RepID=A0ABV0PVS4_9TELE
MGPSCVVQFALIFLLPILTMQKPQFIARNLEFPVLPIQHKQNPYGAHTHMVARKEPSLFWQQGHVDILKYPKTDAFHYFANDHILNRISNRNILN